jgi:hypothetical protein
MGRIKYRLPDKVEKSNITCVKEQADLFSTEINFDFKGSDTQYSTHAIHTYVAAMVPPLAEALVTLYVPRDEVVLDPFCGGGAVLVECSRYHRRAFGSDINPLAVLISKVKSTYIDLVELLEATRVVIATSIRNLNGSISFPEEYNMEYWFLPETIAELSSIIRVIKKYEVENKFSSDVLDALKVAFSSTVRDVMLTYRNEVRLRRLEPQDLEKFHPNTIERFKHRSRLIVDRISSLPKSAHSRVEIAPVQHLPYEDKKFHSIICSPPYGDERNGVSYLQFSKFMLYWLGFTRKAVIESRNRTLGSSYVNIELPSKTLEKVCRIIQKSNGDNRWMNFYREYFLGLGEMVRVTREKIIIVIGNRILKQTVIENGKVTVELMEHYGFTLEKHFQRTLPSKRLPKLRREQDHGFGGAINKEDILIFSER